MVHVFSNTIPGLHYLPQAMHHDMWNPPQSERRFQRTVGHHSPPRQNFLEIYRGEQPSGELQSDVCSVSIGQLLVKHWIRPARDNPLYGSTTATRFRVFQLELAEQIHSAQNVFCHGHRISRKEMQITCDSIDNCRFFRSLFSQEYANYMPTCRPAFSLIAIT